MKEDAYLTIDPGITTGWAVLNGRGEIVATSVWGTGELESSLDALIRVLQTAGWYVRVVIEKMPQTGKMGQLGIKLQKVNRTIRNVVELYELSTVEIAPGEWKPSRTAKLTKVPRTFKKTPLMIHQKDAVKMGRYAIDKKQRTPVTQRSW